MAKALKLLSVVIFVFLIFISYPVKAGNNLIEYNKFLDKLSLDTPVSITKARDKYIALFSRENNPATKEKAFLAFYKFYITVIKDINTHEMYEEKFDQKKELSYIKNGIALRSSEGIAFTAPSYLYLDCSFSKYLSAKWKEYFTFKNKEFKEGYLEDAGLVVKWETLRERIGFMEKFLSKYPDFPLKPELVDNLNSYIGSYVLGENNSPSRDYETARILPEVKLSYSKFLSYNKGSRFYTLISSLYGELKNNKFVFTDEIINNATKKLPHFDYYSPVLVTGYELKNK